MTQWGIEALFNPGKRHMDEEKRRLQATREEVGDSSGGRRIDLDSGTVRIPRKPKAAADEPVEDDSETPSTDSDEEEDAELAQE